MAFDGLGFSRASGDLGKEEKLPPIAPGPALLEVAGAVVMGDGTPFRCTAGASIGTMVDGSGFLGTGCWGAKSGDDAGDTGDTGDTTCSMIGLLMSCCS